MSITAKVTDERRQEPRMRVVREIPLWGVVTLVLTVATFCVATFLNQNQNLRELTVIVTGQTTKIVELSNQVQSLSSSLNSKNLKDLEHDLRLADVVRRLESMEAASGKSPQQSAPKVVR